MTNRDDFSKSTKDALAKRVGLRCSNPECQALTSGPAEVDSKAVNIGVASHIAAAAPGGPRYNPSMSKEERSSINNGIWLCQNCAKLIDDDPDGYPTKKLQDWKKISETKTKKVFGKPVDSTLKIHVEIQNPPIEPDIKAIEAVKYLVSRACGIDESQVKIILLRKGSLIFIFSVSVSHIENGFEKSFNQRFNSELQSYISRLAKVHYQEIARPSIENLLFIGGLDKEPIIALIPMLNEAKLSISYETLDIYRNDVVIDSELRILIGRFKKAIPQISLARLERELIQCPYGLENLLLVNCEKIPRRHLARESLRSYLGVRKLTRNSWKIERADSRSSTRGDLAPYLQIYPLSRFRKLERSVSAIFEKLGYE